MFRLSRILQQKGPRRTRAVAAHFLTMLAVALAVVFASREELSPFAASAPGLKAIDGDTLRKGALRIRLDGIDAPEIGQRCTTATGVAYDCGVKAREVLERLIMQGPTTCRMAGRDRYRRTLAFCRAGKTDLNREMVRLGWAVASERYSTRYLAVELQARFRRLGLWQGKFQFPEIYRKSRANVVFRHHKRRRRHAPHGQKYY